MSEKTFLQLIGQPDVGKSDVAKHVQEITGAPLFSASHALRSFGLRELGYKPVTRGEYRHVQDQYFRTLGHTAMLDEIVSTPGDFVIVDGLRIPAIAFELRNNHPGSILGLVAPPEVRFERRRPGRDSDDFERYLEDERQESFGTGYELGTETILEAADLTIDASQPLGAVLREVDKILPEIWTP